MRKRPPAQLLLGLLVVSVATFSTLAEDVAGSESITFDGTVAAWFHDHATRAATGVFRVVTELGGSAVILAVTLITAAVLLRRSRLQAAFMAAAVVGGEGLNLLLKAAFERPRPSFAHPLATAGGFAFPSGHAMMSLIAYGALAALVAARLESVRARALVFGSATALVLLIGISRVYLGVHYVSDVLGGYSAGLAWLTVCGLALAAVRVRRVGASSSATLT